MVKRFERPSTPEFVAQKRAVGSAELAAIQARLGVNKSEMGRIYQVSQPDFHRMLSGVLSLPERCTPTHRALYLLATGSASQYVV